MEFMYISNKVEDLNKLEEAKIDYIFVDLEIKGKIERQGHLDTVISKHNISDIKNIKKNKKKIKILTRIDPLNEESEKQINEVIKAGTDVIMLPMFKTEEEVEKIIKLINKRVEFWLLLETVEAFARVDKILSLDGVDRIHIGLNDLHLGFGLDFMFECLENGIVEFLVKKIRKRNIKYGIGGIGKLGNGLLDPEIIIKEYVNLGSEMVILSRDFKKNTQNLKKDVDALKNKIVDAQKMSDDEKELNRVKLKRKIESIVKQRKEQR